MNLSKYEHAERKEAEASKDAPETPQDSGAEQKHHTLFGKQFTEKKSRKPYSSTWSSASSSWSSR